MDPLDVVLASVRTYGATYDFLLEDARVSVSGRRTRILLVTGGRLALDDLVLEPGDLLFALPGPERTTVVPAGTEVHSLGLDIEPLTVDPLRDVLPQLIPLSAAGPAAISMTAAIELIAHERQAARPGSEVIVSRLADVVHVTALRAAADCMAQGTWLALLHDPRLSRALSSAHADLARPWTVAELAREAGLSRSAFAAAFREVSGQSPLEHLTWWRIHRAKCLLRSTDLSLGQIGARLGFSSGTALSRVFRQHVGVSPTPWRRAVTDHGPVK